MLKIVDNFLECCSKTMLLYVKRLFPSAILFVTISLIAAPVIGQTSSHPLRALQESFREVSRSVKPAVVNVSTVKMVAGSNFGGLDPFFENHPFREFFRDEFFRQFFGSAGGSRRFRQKGL